MVATMIKQLRRLSLLLIALMAIAADAGAADQISLQLRWKHAFQFAGYYAAVEQGYYRDHGLDVRLI